VDGATRVPVEYVKDGQIVLNISYTATRHLKIENDFIHFSARFNGTSRELEIPISAVIGIFAKENGQGMFFQPTTDGEAMNSAPSEENAPPEPDDSGTKPPRGGHLKVVK
jgi:stringent starvation protein B